MSDTDRAALPVDDKMIITVITIALSIFVIMISLYLLFDSVSTLRASNAALLGIGDSMKGYNEFKIIVSTFLAGFILFFPISAGIWISCLGKNNNSNKCRQCR